MADTKTADQIARPLPRYRVVADELRADIEAGRYAEGRRMPTEPELQDRYGVGRHTVREALQQLHSEGLIYRVRGSGTFVRGRQVNPNRYARSVASLEEIIVWPNTDLEVLETFHTVVEPSIAERLELDYIEVSRATVRRTHDGAPFAITRYFVEPQFGQELARHGVPSRERCTVTATAEPLLPNPIAGALQDLTAMEAPELEAELIGCRPGDPILLIERLYYDTAGRFVELTSSHFNPRRYAYRLDLRRRAD